MPPFLPRKKLSPPPSSESTPSKRKGKSIAAVPRKPTLFDALDDSSTSRNSTEHPKDVLAKLADNDSDDSSSLSSAPSSEPEFEDVPHAKRQKLNEAESEDEDEDIEFEDVHPHNAHTTAVPAPSGDLELKIQTETRVSLVNPHNKKQGPTKIERQIRIATHCMHVQFLMWHNAIRNSWLCDKEIQDVLVKQVLVNPSMQKYIEKWKSESSIELNSATSKTPERGKGKTARSKRKGKNDRGQRDWGEPAQRVAARNASPDALYSILKRLSFYWKQRFRITARGLRKLGYMSLERLDDEMKSCRDAYSQERHGERIRNKSELRSCAEKCEGSRDVGAQLFVALLRGLGLEARLVVSLQPVGFGWSKNEEAVERKKDQQADSTAQSNISESEDGDSEDVQKSSAKTKGNKQIRGESSARSSQRGQKQTPSKGSKGEPIDLSSLDSDSDDMSVIDVTPSRPKRGASKLYEKDLAPNYWVEVLSPATTTYIPVNPFGGESSVATNLDLLANFEPRGAKAEKAKQVMAYIVGFSSDGTAKDITVRYLKRHMWPGKTKGMRMPVEKVPVYNHRGKVKRYEEFDWFKTVMSGYVRRDAQRTAADDIEDATDLKAVQPERKEPKEGEETLQSYKASAEFVLERHLRREEALRPGAEHVKMFTVKGKGDAAQPQEKVFLRKDVVACKSVETWHKEGREPILGEQPRKMVPYRAATINRKREIAEAERASGGEKVLQGLYSRDQTDWIIPPPIENGVIPKNAFGNMDVYVPSMVPQGAVHVPLRGTMRICRKLGIDFAEAVTGFEFGSRMAIPIITGVVIAEENEEMVMESWRIEEAERLRKEDEKRRKAALAMWRKFLMGLRIVERVREEYGDFADENVDEINPWTNKKATNHHPGTLEEETHKRIVAQNEEDMAGGFFLPGHVEEEASAAPARTFFVTRHEDDADDDEAGGLTVEHHDGRDDQVRVAAQQDDESDASHPPRRVLSTSSASKKTISTKGKSARSQPRKQASTRAKKAASTKENKGKRKRLVDDDDNEDEEEGDDSPLSDLESMFSDTDEEEAPRRRQSSKKTRAAAPEASTKSPATRSVPKRKAARVSETALRSHYFEHEDEDDDE